MMQDFKNVSKTVDGMKQRETIESISRICFFKKDGLGIKKMKVLEADEEYRDFERQMKKMKKIKKVDSVY
jgi:hypothetical protein